MQRLLIACTLLIAFTSCRKNDDMLHTGDQRMLKYSLKDSLIPLDYDALDFSRVAHSTVNKIELIRIAFKEKSMAESFVLVQIDGNWNIKKGRIIQITKSGIANSFNGSLVIKTLHGDVIEESKLINGYRCSKKLMTRSYLIEPDPYVVLPEVVVVASHSSSGGIGWSSWYNLVCFFESAENSGSGTGSYWELDPYSGGGGSGSGATGGTSEVPLASGGSGGMIDENVMELDFELQYDNPAIDLSKYLSCFSGIPNAGAICRITIYADVPVDSDPTRIMDWETGSPGHAWLRLEKTNGLQSASQHIGFYPKSGWKTTLTDVPLDGKWVENSRHEFNASYELTVSPESLQKAITQILYLARFKQYDVDDYNCTDWTLEVWRKAISPSMWFDIPKFHMPGSLSTNGTNTPQGLFIKLREMQQVGTPGIEVPVVGYSGNSTGPCN